MWSKQGIVFTEVNDIKDFRTTVLRNSGEQLAVLASGNRYNSRQVCSIVLHELDADILLLPQLDMPIY
jgi:hypothetical protein